MDIHTAETAEAEIAEAATTKTINQTSHQEIDQSSNPMNGEKAKLFKEMIGFAMVGFFNAAVNYGTYVIAITLGAHYLVASVLGYVVSVASAWFWQYFVIFAEGGRKSPEPWYKSFIRTYITYATTGLILTNVLLFLMLDVIHIENFLDWALEWIPAMNFETARDLAEYIAPLIVMAINVPINFLLNKLWAFKK